MEASGGTSNLDRFRVAERPRQRAAGGETGIFPECDSWSGGNGESTDPTSDPGRRLREGWGARGDTRGRLPQRTNHARVDSNVAWRTRPITSPRSSNAPCSPRGQCFRLWRDNVRYELFCQQRRKLAHRLFLARESFAGPYMELRRHMIDMQVPSSLKDAIMTAFFSRLLEGPTATGSAWHSAPLYASQTARGELGAPHRPAQAACCR